MRPYDPAPPKAEQLDLAKFPLKLASMVRDDSKRGWKRYQISLPNNVRGKWACDALHAGEWRALIQEFDQKPIVENFAFVSRGVLATVATCSQGSARGRRT